MKLYINNLVALAYPAPGCEMQEERGREDLRKLLDALADADACIELPEPSQPVAASAAAAMFQ
jgi:hypothetical protein